MFIAGDAIGEFFRLCWREMPEDLDELAKYKEQAIFNILAETSTKIKVHYLPAEWNYIVRHETGPRDDVYINHYGGAAQKMIADKP
jgi:hypothetical protein